MTKVGAALCNMPRTFNDVLREVKAQSEPQRKTVLSQISALPGQQVAEESGLEAKKNQAYDDILGGARRRGLGFSGIPLGEQARYNATDYAPAVANLKSSYVNRRSTLDSALADIGANNYATAQDIYNQDRAFAEQQRQFNADLALKQQEASAASNTFSPTVSSGGGNSNKPPAANMQQRPNGGFNFQDSQGKSISAARYATLTGQDIRDVLYDMGKSGDKYAAQLYNQLSSPDTAADFQRRPNVYRDLYKPIFWGT